MLRARGDDPPLPVEAALPELLDGLGRKGAAVLVAPPGAGKTTLVPLALAEARNAPPGRILMLEPRRLAARAAAERMSEMLGAEVGGPVGYRIRGESRTGPDTRVEVVTEGILTRMIQSDPELAGVGAVIFDEFHERSLNADLGLALVLEARAALRPDLWLVVMSATLDAGPVAALMGDAPVVVAEGRSFPVETRFTPVGRHVPLAGPEFLRAGVALVHRALAESAGGVLVFLPGEGEIRRMAAALALELPVSARLRPLFGAMPFAEQRAAIRPETTPGLRKIVLATAIAETSLTIEDIRVVVDLGRARRARFDPDSGLTRLVTERVSRAEADQRAGRAGRVAPGVAWRLWPASGHGALPAFAPPEIETADLSGLALELALWGVRDATTLPFLTPPPSAALSEGRALLEMLGALSTDGTITPKGRAMAALPLHPRLARVVVESGRDAALAAALLSERDPMARDAGGASADLALRWDALHGRTGARLDPGRAARTREVARLLPAGRGARADLGEMAALAYPDRIARRRPGSTGRYLLAAGTGAKLDADDRLARAEWLVVTDLAPREGEEARIRLAVEIDEATVRRVAGGHISREEHCRWDRRLRAVRARRRECLGPIVLSEAPWPDCPPDRFAAALLEGVRDSGLEVLNWTEGARRLQARTEWLRRRGGMVPDLSSETLMAELESWLAPHLPGLKTWDTLRAMDLEPILRGLLDHAARRDLDRQAPARFVAPTGTGVVIEYRDEGPDIAIRLQELFGLEQHPVIGPGNVPLRITLLSPAGRPLQTTEDLPGFWAGSYADVRREMRGRYPRHPWPEDPARAEPTRRAKPRKR